MSYHAFGHGQEYVILKGFQADVDHSVIVQAFSETKPDYEECGVLVEDTWMRNHCIPKEFTFSPHICQSTSHKEYYRRFTSGQSQIWLPL